MNKTIAILCIFLTAGRAEISQASIESYTEDISEIMKVASAIALMHGLIFCNNDKQGAQLTLNPWSMKSSLYKWFGAKNGQTRTRIINKLVNSLGDAIGIGILAGLVGKAILSSRLVKITFIKS